MMHIYDICLLLCNFVDYTILINRNKKCAPNISNTSILNEDYINKRFVHT